MFRKLLPLFAFLVLFGPVVSRPTSGACNPALAKGTDWIVVPWTHGGCYYHNTKTREDTDHLPAILRQRQTL